MLYIDNDINRLPSEERKRFEESLEAVRSSDTWLQTRGFSGTNFNLSLVKITLYREMFEEGFYHLIAEQN